MDYKSIYNGGPQATRMRERLEQASDTQHNAGLIARRPQVSPPCYFFFCFLSPQNDVLLGEKFFFFCELGRRKGSRWASNGFFFANWGGLPTTFFFCFSFFCIFFSQPFFLTQSCIFLGKYYLFKINNY